MLVPGAETEINNFGFEIERKTPKQISWNQIGFVAGNGNSNSPIHYLFKDENTRKGGIFWYRLKQRDTDGSFDYSNEISVNVNKPDKFLLEQNYPNPFNPETRIDYTLPVKQNVSLRVYNMLGELVQELVNEVKEAGSYSVTFDGSSAGGGLPSGIYVYRIQTEGFSENKKMTLLK